MGQIPSVVVPPTRTQRLNAPGNPSASNPNSAAFFDPWSHDSARFMDSPVSTSRGLIGSVWGTSLRPRKANLSAQSDVVVARPRARCGPPKFALGVHGILRTPSALKCWQ